jgi:hypothetical protein
MLCAVLGRQPSCGLGNILPITDDAPANTRMVIDIEIRVV